MPSTRSTRPRSHTSPRSPSRAASGAVAYYRGELFVADGHSTVYVYGTDGKLHRQFATSPLIGPVTGLEVAWGEVWATAQGGPLGGSVAVFDATTGALKTVIWHRATLQCVMPWGLASCPVGAPLADAGPGWTDIAAIPDYGAVAAGCGFIDRNAVLTAASIDGGGGDPTRYPQCASRGWDDIDVVWGMHWLLAVNSMDSTLGDEIDEYDLSQSDAASGQIGNFALSAMPPARTWQPYDSASANHRDVSYQNRPVRIDWSGPLTTSNWLTGNQCLSYTVSDADIFVVGSRAEHWLEQARNPTSVQLTVDGTVQATSTAASGQLCFDTTTVASGQHTLVLTANLSSGAPASNTNAQLHVDHTLPSGAIDPPPQFVHGQLHVSGSMSDAHSGPRDWTLQVSPTGQNSWTTVCSAGSPDVGTGKYGYTWDTTGLADGTYDLRSQMRDLVDAAYGGPNVGYTASVTTTVDNTPPTFTSPAPALGSDDGDTIVQNDALVVFSQSDATSGIGDTTLQ